MVLFFAALLLLGAIMLFFALKWSIQSARFRKIAQFPLDEAEHLITMPCAGTHSISFIGAGYVNPSNGFSITVAQQGSNIAADLYTYPLKYRHTISGSMSVEYAYFTTGPGTYILRCRNAALLQPKPSMLFSRRMFQRPLQPASLMLAVKQSLTYKQKLLSIVFLVIGLQAIVGGVAGIAYFC